MSIDLARVLGQYAFRTGSTIGEPLGNGHMHETYFVPGAGADSHGFVVQRINDRVFRDVPALMHNVRLVTGRMADWAGSRSVDGAPMAALRLEITRDGSAFYQDGAGKYWRVFQHIAPSVSYEVADSPQRLFEAGVAIGRFQRAVSGLEPSDIHITIPRFHDLPWRLEQLDQAVAADAAGRLSECASDLDFVTARSGVLSDIFLDLQRNRLPVRITHNDTKLNNVLFDPDGRALCLIDLDTVMPGYVQYDFGDAVRSGCSCTEEDDRNSSGVGINLEYLRAFATGYFREARPFLNESELAYFASSPRLLTFIMGVRFLADHINGDVYYRIAYPGHNLVRARNQLALVGSLENKHRAIVDIVKASWDGNR